MSDAGGPSTTTLVALTSVFVTSLVAAQLLSAKIAVLSLPLVGVVTLPLAGAVTYPTGTLAYAGTFFATDVTGELYGRDVAHRMVNVGFVMNFLLLALVAVALLAPASGTGASEGAFAAVVGASGNVVVGSLVAYVVSQNWDVFVFHRLREATDGRWLWTRNVGSTGSSQLLDTVIFTTVAFWAAPQVLGGFTFSPTALLATVVGQYVLKLAIALLDTPLVYAAVGYLRRAPGPATGADPA